MSDVGSTSGSLVDGDEAIEAKIVEHRSVVAADGPIPGQGLTISGWILLVTGMVMAIVACLFETSVESPSSGSAYLGTYVPASNVINIGLQQKQMMIFLSGLALCLAGVIGIFLGTATSAIRSALQSGGRA